MAADSEIKLMRNEEPRSSILPLDILDLQIGGLTNDANGPVYAVARRACTTLLYVARTNHTTVNVRVREPRAI